MFASRIITSDPAFVEFGNVLPDLALELNLQAPCAHRLLARRVQALRASGKNHRGLYVDARQRLKCLESEVRTSRSWSGANGV